MDRELRAKIGGFACSIAKEANYKNAGTCEFIMDQDKNFYFLEMNTRLQVEHPITELVTSLDLVELQLRIASGEPLNLTQEEIQFKGSAIEARICAENPYKGFLPTTGIVTRYAMPRGKNIRVDSGICAGSMVTIHFDSLLAKVAVWGETRNEAIQTMGRALNGYHIEGVTTNLDFANAIINHPSFANAELSTDFINEHFIDGLEKDRASIEKLHYMVIASALVYHTRQQLVIDSLKPMSPVTGGTSNPKKKYDYIAKIDNDVFEVSLNAGDIKKNWLIEVNKIDDSNTEADKKTYDVITPEFEYYRRRLKLSINDNSQMFRLNYHENHTRIAFCGLIRTCAIYSPREWELYQYMVRDTKEIQDNTLRCPMPGLITSICVKEGEQVNERQELVRMESMKMETGIASITF
ncbi:carbamoyl-phosphate synthase L chain ATP-binding [Candidatus Magnetoovum chiemensis]|nr:carbamoyl-phosphate synthase L chain ATP-binding [Candidatus Magnetoovum chiemensis]